MTPEDLLEGLPSELAAVAQRLRDIVRTTTPQAIERAYPGWKGIGYRHPQAGYFCAIFPSRDRVSLAFEHGALLADPRGHLRPGRTSGKKVRYLELRTAGELRAEVVRRFIQAAIALKAGSARGSQSKGGVGRRRRGGGARERD